MDGRVDEPGAAGISARILSATLGAYLVAYTLTEALAGALFAAGWGKVDAAITSSTAGLLLFPAVSIWAFAERRTWMVLAAPALVAAALTVLGKLVRP